MKKERRNQLILVAALIGTLFLVFFGEGLFSVILPVTQCVVDDVNQTCTLQGSIQPSDYDDLYELVVSGSNSTELTATIDGSATVPVPITNGSAVVNISDEVLAACTAQGNVTLCDLTVELSGADAEENIEAVVNRGGFTALTVDGQWLFPQADMNVTDTNESTTTESDSEMPEEQEPSGDGFFAGIPDYLVLIAGIVGGAGLALAIRRKK